MSGNTKESLEDQIKNRAKSFIDKGKEKLFQINDMSLGRKLGIVVIFHYGLRAILGGKREVADA